MSSRRDRIGDVPLHLVARLKGALLRLVLDLAVHLRPGKGARSMRGAAAGRRLSHGEEGSVASWGWGRASGLSGGGLNLYRLFQEDPRDNV